MRTWIEGRADGGTRRGRVELCRVYFDGNGLCRVDGVVAVDLDVDAGGGVDRGGWGVGHRGVGVIVAVDGVVVAVEGVHGDGSRDGHGG